MFSYWSIRKNGWVITVSKGSLSKTPSFLMYNKSPSAAAQTMSPLNDSRLGQICVFFEIGGTLSKFPVDIPFISVILIRPASSIIVISFRPLWSVISMGFVTRAFVSTVFYPDCFFPFIEISWILFFEVDKKKVSPSLPEE